MSASSGLGNSSFPPSPFPAWSPSPQAPPSPANRGYGTTFTTDRILTFVIGIIGGITAVGLIFLFDRYFRRRAAQQRADYRLANPTPLTQVVKNLPGVPPEIVSTFPLRVFTPEVHTADAHLDRTSLEGEGGGTSPGPANSHIGTMEAEPVRLDGAYRTPATPFAGDKPAKGQRTNSASASDSLPGRRALSGAIALNVTARDVDMEAGLDGGMVADPLGGRVADPLTPADVHPTPMLMEEADESQCTICLADYENGDMIRQLPCMHEFHMLCIDGWMVQHKTCPICRHLLVPEAPPVHAQPAGHDEPPAEEPAGSGPSTSTAAATRPPQNTRTSQT